MPSQPPVHDASTSMKNAAPSNSHPIQEMHNATLQSCLLPTLFSSSFGTFVITDSPVTEHGSSISWLLKSGPKDTGYDHKHRIMLRGMNQGICTDESLTERILKGMNILLEA